MTATRDDIVANDKKYVWHPYTAMEQYRADTQPLVIERAEGSRLFDVDGRNLIDGNASWWVALLGHRHPRLIKTVREQTEKLCHVAMAGITHEAGAMLAKELIEVAPAGLEHVFYSDNGSTAVEAAIKMATQYWYQAGTPRSRFIALSHAFHGDTVGATGIGGVEVFRRPFADITLDCVHVAPPVSSDEPAESVYQTAFATISELLERDGAQIAAVVVEPIVQGAAGMQIYAPQYLADLRRLCDTHDTLLIVDEVFTGYGRTGPMWACDHAGITPDIMCLAKGFTCGILPMAATLTTKRVFDGFLGTKDRAFYYGHTYYGHALGAAVAREVLNIYRDENILAAAAAKARVIADFFEQLSGLDGVARTRSLGMIGALDLAGSGGYLGGKGWKVYEAALERGAYLRPLGDVVYITPPLNIPDDDLGELLQILEASLRVVL